MSNVPELFGSLVFNDKTMKERLPKQTYRALKNTIMNGQSLDINVANIVANAMKDWAVEHGCTHYTHWFQPMTGVTAEKHDSFINPTEDGKVIMEFILLPMLSLKTARYVFPQLSVHTQAMFSTKKHRFFVQWKLSATKL